MNCAEWEERIALYAGGDLADGSVERHLAECPGCQVFATGMQQALEVLRTERYEIEPAHYAAVRARVLAEVARPRQRWIWAWAAVAGCAAILAGLGIEQQMRVEPLPAEVSLAPAAPAPPVGSAVRRAAAAAAARPRRRARSRPRSDEVVVKVETDVPDVVIYWIAETRGETR